MFYIRTVVRPIFSFIISQETKNWIGPDQFSLRSEHRYEKKIMYINIINYLLQKNNIL